MLSEYKPSPHPPLDLPDPFLATSVLQKSLRRADPGYAIGAAKALLDIDPPRLWKRLVIVAVEDFGLSDLSLTSQIISAASDKAWRRRVGGDQKIMSYLIERLLRCPRDRRIDETYMLSVALSRSKDPNAKISSLGASQVNSDMLRRAVALILRCEQVIPYRGIRAIIATECDVAIARMARKGWVDRGLEQACTQARRTSQCLLPVLLPLLKTATEKAGGQTSVVKRNVTEVREIDGLPSYALDGYTRPGRVALSILASRERRLARLLAPLSTGKAKTEALVNLLFMVEGGVCSTELSNPLYDELKLYSLGCWTGLASASLADAVSVMQQAIPTLNEIRADIRCAAR